MPATHLKAVIEAALLASGKPLSLDALLKLFENNAKPATKSEIKAALDELEKDCAERGIELQQVSSGYRFQVKAEFAPQISMLWEEKPARYTRALLETLALIAYRQPVTRAEIEDVRGVSVSSNIIKTLTEREWVQVIGHREVPGRPALYATTRTFLDYFNLRSLDELASLAQLQDIDSIPSLALTDEPMPDEGVGREETAH
jgi:segregation and condensation protein B